jgi:hypothetical protein
MGFAFGHFIVLEDDILDDGPNLVSANADPPALIGDNIIDTFIARMTGRLHCVASKRTRSRGAVASAYVDGVGGMAKVVDGRVAPHLGNVGVRAGGHR